MPYTKKNIEYLNKKKSIKVTTLKPTQDKLISKFMRWFFISNFLGSLYICMLLCAMVENYGLFLLFLLALILGSVISWFKLTTTAFKLGWRN